MRKIHLAIGIGQKAIVAGYNVAVYHRAMPSGDHGAGGNPRRAEKTLTSLGKFDILIIDEPGYLPMGNTARYNLFQLVNSLYEYRSIILTTNKEFTDCGDYFYN